MHTFFTYAQIYGEEFGIKTTENVQRQNGNHPTSGGNVGVASTMANAFATGRRTVRNRKISDQSCMQTSPKRKESLAKRDRIHHYHDDGGGGGSDGGAGRMRSKSTGGIGGGGGKSPAQSQGSDNKDGGRGSAGAKAGAGCRNGSTHPADDPLKAPVFKYCKNHVRKLFHFPLAALIKGAAILTEDLFVEAIPAAWEMLLEADQELSANAAALFIIASVRAPTAASDVMQRALKHRDANVRIGAILRYQVLWKCRFQVWPRMEDGAHIAFKVPPPGIEFTLPSPKIGIECLPVVDPPWTPRTKTKDMEVTLNQERHVSEQ